jgi:hypothetical protein
MAADAIRAALDAAREAWVDAEEDGYGLDADGKAAVQQEIDDAVLSLEQAARLALVDTS